MACVENLKLILSMIQVSKQVDRSLEEVLETFFALEEVLELFWLSAELDGLSVDNHWEALAREALRDDLEWQHRTLVIGILSSDGGEAGGHVTRWLKQHHALVTRWQMVIEEIKMTNGRDYPIFSVVLRELLDLANSVGDC